MAFDSTTRGKLQRLVAACRKLLADEFDDQLQSLYGIYAKDGRVLDLDTLRSLDDDQRAIGALLRERIAHLQSGLTGSKTPLADAVQRVLREQAFTLLNRFAALRMAEERELVLQCVGDGLNSKGFQVFENVASPDLGSQYERYRVFLDCLFDELSLDLGVLFDRFSPFGLLFPREPKLKEFLQLLNDPELKSLWREDETIGWIYQYFNDEAERKKMREESSAPRNSRELAVRNQFFTPRYVVEFLTDNTLGRLWYEMTRGETGLRDRCRYLVRRPTEIFLKPGESAPESAASGEAENLSQEELLRQPVHIPHRPLKDPREIRLLDPACGSMHFGLYAFDLFTVIYDEAWEIAHGPDDAAKSAESFAPFVTFAATFPDKAAFLREVPRLIVERNIHGIDIDPRAAQIAGLSLWLRAQRAWFDQEKAAKDRGVTLPPRPRITRSNLVCAEPMPGEKELLREFVEQQFVAGERPAFAFLLEKIFDCMTLAGEAGSLLRIEEEIRTAIADAKRLWKQGPKVEQAMMFSEPGEKAGQGEMRLDLSGITDEQFWERAEQRIYDALETYAGQAENGGGFQRRLFADDAAQGFAFIDLCRKRYDVVVMNPPFGEPAVASKEYVDSSYPDSCQDIFAAFVERGVAAAPKSGFVGVISTEAGFFRRTLEPWRRRVLLSRSTMGVMAHLGGHVLDGATVRTATYVLQTPRVKAASLFLRLLGQEDRETRFFDTIQALKRGAATPNVYQTAQSEFEKLPYAVFGYWCSPAMRDAFVDLPKVEKNAHVRQGLASGDDFRFLRLRWEVSEATVGEKAIWAYFAKGGEYSPYHDEVHLLVRWEHQGAEVKAAICQRYPYLNGQWQWVVKNTDYYFRPGITFPRRTNKRFAPRVMPGGCAFGDKGPAIVDINGSPWGLLAVLNSRPLSYLMGLALGAAEAEGGAGANSYEVGLVQRLPIPHEALSDPRLVELAKNCWAARSQKDLRTESCAVFLQPFAGTIDSSILKSAATLYEQDNESVAKYVELQSAIDARVTELYRFSAADWREIEEHAGELHIPPHSDEPDADELAASIVSHAFGILFGRWDIRYATGERPAPELPDPFAPLPVCPPGMLQGDDGLPLSPVAGRRLRAEDRYPLDVAWDGILVDDPEHPLDLERRTHAALAVLWGDRADALEHEACVLLGVPTLREWFRRPAGFFADHLKRYTKSRRQAPIYWPLSTASGRYTLWLYHHRLNDQTLYTCVTDFVKPKLDAVTADADRLQAKTQTGGTSKERAELQELRDFQTELQELHDELLRVAQLPWKPNLNDGVLITASPLWKLFRLPAWRSKLESCWEELAAGDYDWAHLALTIWPDRVREKCKKDRSLAIAHSLEDVCEVEAPKPKATKAKKSKAADKEREAKKEALCEELTEAFAEYMLGQKFPLDVVNGQTGELIIPANRMVTKTLLRKLASLHEHATIDPSPMRNRVREIIAKFEPRFAALETAEQTEMPMKAEPASRPAPRAAAMPVREVKVVSNTAPATVPIDQIDRTEVLCTIRQVFSTGGARDRETAMRDVAEALGYQRLGSHIREVLNTDFLTAVRRGILENESGQLKLLVADVRDYEREFQKDNFLSAIGRTWIEREDAIRLFARWLGYARTGPVIEDTARSLINGLLREGHLEKDGERVRRC
jgi:hypothetical protein